MYKWKAAAAEKFVIGSVVVSWVETEKLLSDCDGCSSSVSSGKYISFPSSHRLALCRRHMYEIYNSAFFFMIINNNKISSENVRVCIQNGSMSKRCCTSSRAYVIDIYILRESKRALAVSCCCWWCCWSGCVPLLLLLLFLVFPSSSSSSFSSLARLVRVQ